MTNRALVVDDDETIRKVLAKVLASNGLEATLAEDGETALTLISGNPDVFQIILLDVMLGANDGFSVLKAIRSQGILTPVIIISARNEDYNTLYGLGIGADDYIAKPFNPIVLGAKIQALIRRANLAQKEPNPIISLGPFMLNTKTLHFFKHDQELFLSGKELSLMQLFMSHPKQVFSKEALYQQVWGNTVVDDNTIMVYINRLRAKIEDNAKEPKYLVTVWGVGYVFSV
ncbi:MAG: response regulator transcription factor [Sphaerochaeta sp.]|jgi:DNA-binding response OmpR family regulator|uniref:response regulator transcription factor n=1 Tax=Sphaerochaeta sp. TaxID=1972642 RepID=UPI002FCB7066